MTLGQMLNDARSCETAARLMRERRKPLVAEGFERRAAQCRMALEQEKCSRERYERVRKALR